MTPRSVGILGGGTAGWLTALALKRHFPSLSVSLVESKEIPIIGVGEATTTLMPPFLHAQLGLDIVELFHAVRPTFKLGIRFEWGGRDFNYPFGDTAPVAAAAFDGDLGNQSLVSRLMDADRVPEPALLPRLKFAYHLDNQPFVAFLAAAGKRAGIEHRQLTVGGVRRGDRGIESLDGGLDGGLRFDLYVDATGFSARLAGDNPFLSYASSLLCDRAIVATVPQPGAIRPYTTAETMPSGWCWRIPVEGEDHRGYVHSSAFVSEDAAVAEMRARNPDMGEPRVVHFRSGRRRDFWSQNCVSIGNAYGFVEPLESTALHMIIVEIGYLLHTLESGDIAFANEAVGAHWDFLRWFLALHYKFNHRLDTPFWRAARADTDVSGLQAAIDEFQRDGPSSSRRFHAGDPAFGHSGVTLLLLGQQVPAPLAVPPARAAWDRRAAAQRQIVLASPSQREALDFLRANPRYLRELASSGWVAGSAERIVIEGRTPAHPRAG